MEASLAEATDRVNLRQTQRVISEIKVKYPNVETIAICGLSYKKNSVVTEESAALKIANALSQSGYTVSAWDALLKERPTDLVSDVSFVTSVSSLAYKDLLIKTQDTTELKPIVDSFANILDFS